MVQEIVREIKGPSRRAGIWLAAALTFFALGGTLDADPKIEVGEPVAVSGERTEIPQVEPSLAAHPEKPGLLFGAAVTFPDFRKGLDVTTVAGFRSADGGRSWQSVPFPACRIDPWVSFGSGDRVYLSCMGGRQSPLIVYRSADAGRTWSGPVRVTALEGVDRPVVSAVHKAGSPEDSVLVAFGQSSPAPGLRNRTYGAAVSRSDDGGRTFSGPVAVRHDALTQQPFDAAVLSSGVYVLFFMDYATRDGGELLAHRRTWAVRSEDGGRTFSTPVLVFEQLGREMPWAVAVDRSTRHRDRLYLAVDGSWQRRGTGPPAPGKGLFLLISDDGGESWRTAGTVTDAPAGANAETPAIAVNREGVVGVAWYDTRRDPTESCYDLYFSASLDGGATFLPNERVTPVSSCPQTSPQQQGVASRWSFGGDYSGLAADADGKFHILWADSRSGIYRLWTADVRVNLSPRPVVH
ncbi:MAG: hypothetical protein DMF53_06405 [Acidobacteria bacterium]|nr:MAG: hypothetical protein DMF53_06405 [Acidobacteriota bacterium]